MSEATRWVLESIWLCFRENRALVPTVMAVGTVGRLANVRLVHENLNFAESSQICGRVAAAALSRCPRKAPKLAGSAYFPHFFLGGQRRAVITGLSWRHQEARDGDLFRFVRIVVGCQITQTAAVSRFLHAAQSVPRALSAASLLHPRRLGKSS